MLKITRNVTGHHRGPKRKLWAGYRAPSLQRTCYVPSVIFFIVECGIVRFLCAMRVFDVRTSSSPLGYPCVKFRLSCPAVSELARGEKSRTRSLTHSVTHSLTQLNLFDVPETEAFASE